MVDISRVLHAWIAFRESHDLDKAEMLCCDVTQELYNALTAFEAEVRGQVADYKAKNAKPN